MSNKLREEFLEYTSQYSWNKPRSIPANPRTVARHRRGLELVEKLIGHSLDTVNEEDQLQYIDRIVEYAQGTRRVSTQIFQRFIHWGNKNNHFTCDNLIRGKEDFIIGPHTELKYVEITQHQARTFLKNLKDTEHYLMFSLTYYGGLTSAELSQVRVKDVNKNHVIVYREARKEVQMVVVSNDLQKELYEYAQSLDREFMFDLDQQYDSIRSRIAVTHAYNRACVLSGKLIGTTFRDFRIAAIRHFLYETKDESLTKAFAGAAENKKGWFTSLLSDTDTYLNRARVERKVNGKYQKIHSR